MYKLLIVDDEPTIRRGLSQFIPWDALDVSVVGEASNGTEAVAMIEALAPEIVVTDIRMPGMDGIALSKWISETHPAIKCIILTGYAEFEYAQSAIRYGVVDFVLKPTSRDKLIQAVQLAQERIRNSRGGGDERERALLREQLLQQLTRGDENGPELISRAENCGVRLDGYFIAAFQLSEYQLEKKQPHLLSLKNMISMQTPKGFCYLYEGDLVLNIMPSQAGGQAAVAAVCREICDAVNNFSNTRVSAGVSLFHRSLRELSAAGWEAVQALARHFYDDSELCFYCEGLAKERAWVDHTPFLCGLEAHLESYDFDAAQADLDAFFAGQRKLFSSAREIIGICIQIQLICARVLSKSGREPLAASPDAMECNSLSELEAATRAVLAETEEKLRVRAKRISATVTQALEYVDGHLAGDLRLDAIAGAVHLNPHHLCRIFKKETGETLGDYITRTRVEKAKELLMDRDRRAYEVAELVGFNDPAYFSSTFKKVTGLSPKEFQAQASGRTKEESLT